ncbi:MAG TPA: DegT/DnrJ/EryC1/StrS family aminotransferase [Solirubrobacterales bacterium]|nr:DegT/DnrJ/EryC1/StrS family aminotransferase [Solirubrobacterales bacterium]
MHRPAFESTAPLPYLDLRTMHLELEKDLEAAFGRVLRSGWYLLGSELEEFEREFAAFCGSRHCVGVATGVSAIELALRAHGIGPGDEVVVPAYTWIATWLAVSRTGARPVGVDVEEATYNLDADLIGAAITDRTAAIVPVHLRGEPADMDAIAAVAGSAGLLVVEDAAQAHGARHRGRRVGGIGHAGAFSFYPTKNLAGIGDGGAVTTDDDGVAERLRRLRNYGMRDRYEIVEAGVNSRLGEVHAAALRTVLPRLEDWNRSRAALAEVYLEAFRGHESISVPAAPAWADPVWHLFVIGHPDRDSCARLLDERGIGTLVHYPVLPHRAPPYREQWPQGSFPTAERLAARALSLPLYPQLEPAACERVAAAVLASVASPA